MDSKAILDSKTDPKLLYLYIRYKQVTNSRIIRSLSDSGEDLSTPAEIADGLNTYFQSVFVKEKSVYKSLHHFASRTCYSNDDVKTISTLEEMQGCSVETVAFILQKSCSEGIVPLQWKKGVRKLRQ